MQLFNGKKLCTLFVAACLGMTLHAQVTKASYEDALSLGAKYRGLTVDVPDAVHWLENSDKFWYRKTVSGGHAFVLVDAQNHTRGPAFDALRLASSLNAADHQHYTAESLPFTLIHFENSEKQLVFVIDNVRWRCDLASYGCTRVGALNPDDPEYRGNEIDAESEEGFTPHINSLTHSKISPDGKWEALVLNYNVVLRHRENGISVGEPLVLSQDGSEDNYYTLRSLAWSPDSKHLAVYRVRPGYKRLVHYIRSSPPDQLQPEYSSMVYPKPGDVLDLQQPVLFNVETKQELGIEDALFPNPFELSPIEWWKDGRGFTFEYNQRGHQVYRIIEVDSVTGHARSLISEQSDTFIDYRRVVPVQTDTGKTYRYDVADGKEIIWMSERDGWAHLYLYNGHTGALENKITSGNWVVRGVDWVDEAHRQIWFEASGMHPEEDPYFLSEWRINFDGTGLTKVSDSDADHQYVWSPDHKYYVDTWSRVDLAPTMVLRRVSDNSTVMTLEHGDISKLEAAGWKPPEVFHAPGRDGKTQIWGVIYRPAHFDPSKKYPVIEDIYAGPQGSFVPKMFGPNFQPLTQLGFVVVQIDGMGTNNRSKAFHDVIWKNLKDAGFPDRILWHKAVAAKYPWYDISRVGIFGTSAGGQNAMAALLFHPEFYKVAVANSGCHDNRMDKIWWNEQWMGWPVGPQYAASSNVVNAYRLQGKLMLVVGEMDHNVDPSSTFQVIDALMKANKDYTLLFVPGGGHGSGGDYGRRKMFDFFVHNLQGVEPPDWNAIPATADENVVFTGR